MALFQVSVLNTYLKSQEEQKLANAFKKFSKYFHNPAIQENIRNSKEEQFQATFLNELFVNVLGYTLNPQPDFNLSTEFKNENNARKADGAILKDGAAIGVIELKGTNTKDLEGIRRQAFDYKVNQKSCVYVITSNFEKLRFYINDATEFIEFDLFLLTAKDFALLYLCLQKENILKNLPLKIKESSMVKEEQITKEFYKDYSVFKRELYRDLVRLNSKTLKKIRLSDPNFSGVQESNPDYAKSQAQLLRLEKNVKLELFKKSQKLIDRFLFIFFAEDRGLLPPNSTIRIVKDWNKLKELDAVVPLYNRFKLYFSYLDQGRKSTDSRAEIFAYNGGLFKPDNLLDRLEINDELLAKHTTQLSKYDFESQVDVNILGHIFENSLNEIEGVNAEIEGADFDKQKSKRKKDGVFYTPKFITKYIVENTLGRLCEEKKSELGFKEEEYFKGRKQRQTKTLEGLIKILDDYRGWLLQLTICDPACGSGAFLNQALDFLIKEHRYIDELKAKLLGGGLVFSDIETTILENNIFGVDINEESIEIAKLSLWLRTAQPRRKLNDLSSNIKCGNSLIDDKKVAGNKAFKWEEEFQEIFSNGGFDVVIGNPPYVRAELLGEFIGYLQNNFKVFHSASDLFAYFYELGSSIINKNGYMGYISNTFDKTTAGKVLREYLKEKTSFLSYVDFTEVQIFEGATTYPVIIILESNLNKENTFNYTKINNIAKQKVIDIERFQKIEVAQDLLQSESWSFLPLLEAKMFKRFSTLPNIKQVYGKCYRGLITGLNEAFIVQNDLSLSDHVKLVIEGKEIKKWNSPPVQQKLIFFESKWTKQKYPEANYEEEFLANLKQDFPSIIQNLEPYETKAKKRYDKGQFWWELRNCAYYDLFEKPKIIFPNLQNSNKFSFDSNGLYVNAPAVFLPTEDKALLGILNSKIVWEFLKSICVVRSGGYIEVKPQYFEQIPIPKIKNRTNIENHVKKIISLTKELQNVQNKFQTFFSKSFLQETISKKLQNWHELGFFDFIKELNKVIKREKREPLTKKDEFIWMELFEENKKKAVELQQQITATDREIDQMVYELYELTEEEITIVESS